MATKAENAIGQLVNEIVSDDGVTYEEAQLGVIRTVNELYPDQVKAVAAQASPEGTTVLVPMDAWQMLAVGKGIELQIELGVIEPDSANRLLKKLREA